MEEKRLVRVRRSEAEWREIFQRHSRSGMTVERFCEVEGIAVGGFHRWRRRLSERSAVPFLELSPELLRRGRVRAELDLGHGIVFRVYG
jgi:hypothetical protein